LIDVLHMSLRMRVLKLRRGAIHIWHPVLVTNLFIPLCYFEFVDWLFVCCLNVSHLKPILILLLYLNDCNGKAKLVYNIVSKITLVAMQICLPSILANISL